MHQADDLIRRLALLPHPEGGYYRETHRDAVTLENGRSCATAIYFLLKRDQRSHWHRVDATEIWHWYSGDPLILSIAPAGGPAQDLMLGPPDGMGSEPQRSVPAGAWQSARSLGAYTLVGCTVSPGFEFSGFELAPPDFVPHP